MDTITAIILSTFITPTKPPVYCIKTKEATYTLCDTLVKPGFENYFFSGMNGNSFWMLVKGNQVKNIIAK